MSGFYGSDGGGNPPKYLKLNHPLDDVTRILSILEAVDWRWSIAEILDQDEAWLDDILAMKTVGEKIKSQMKKQRKPE